MTIHEYYQAHRALLLARIVRNDLRMLREADVAPTRIGSIEKEVDNIVSLLDSAQDECADKLPFIARDLLRNVAALKLAVGMDREKDGELREKAIRLATVGLNMFASMFSATAGVSGDPTRVADHYPQVRRWFRECLVERLSDAVWKAEEETQREQNAELRRLAGK
jgi:hypothetical protein